MTSATTTKAGVLIAAKEALLDSGYARLSTRAIAERAGVPLSQIHYHFGSKQNLVLAVLADENQRLLRRQSEMFAADEPLWKQWEQACDFLDDDLESGYVRVLQEMIAAGWSNPEVAVAVRAYLEGWFTLLRDVAASATGRLGQVATLEADDVGTLVGAAFLGAEAMILLGLDADGTRQALRSVGEAIRRMEENAGEGASPRS